MPASRRTSASEHDEELAGHLQGLSLAGERADRGHSPGNLQQIGIRVNNGRYPSVEAGVSYNGLYNAGMMLDQQLDQEMHSKTTFSFYFIPSHTH